MVTDNNSQINSFIGGMNSDDSYLVLPDTKYTYAENLRLLSTNSTNTSDITNTLSEIRPITGIKECGEIVNVKKILACGHIRNYGIIIYVSTDDTWNVARFINKDGIKLPKSKDKHLSYNDINIPNKDDIFHDLEIVTIFKSKTTPKVNKFSIEFRYEDEDQVKLYIADSEHPIILLNIAESNDNLNRIISEYNNPIDSVIAYPKIKFNPFKFNKVISGTLRPSLVQYSYQLYNKNGNFTDISPTTKLIPIITGNGGKTTEGYDKETEHSSMGVELLLNIDEEYIKYYNKIVVYRITYIENGQAPIVEIIIDSAINKFSSSNGNYIIRDIGLPALEINSLEEYNNKSGIHIIPKVIESHLDYLFAANVKINNNKIEEESLENFTNNITPYFVKIRLIGDGEYHEEHWKKDVNGIVPYNLKNNICSYLNDKTSLIAISILTPNVINPSLLFFDVKIYDTNGNEVNSENSNYNKLIEKANQYIEQCLPNLRNLDYSDPFITYYFKSLRRDETYRYGIVYYNKYGESSSVFHIKDIITPNIHSNSEFLTFSFLGNIELGTFDGSKITPPKVTNGTLYVFPIGLIFDMPEDIPEDVVSYEIVRCKRNFSDIKNIYQGVLSRPTQKLKFVTTISDGNDLDEKVGVSLNGIDKYFYPYNPIGLITDQNYMLGNIYGGSFEHLFTESGVNQEIFFGTNKFNYDLFLFICPEVCFQNETFKSTIKNLSFDLEFEKFLYPLGYENEPSTYHLNSQSSNNSECGYTNVLEYDDTYDERVKGIISDKTINLIRTPQFDIYGGIGSKLKFSSVSDNYNIKLIQGIVENQWYQIRENYCLDSEYSLQLAKSQHEELKGGFFPDNLRTQSTNGFYVGTEGSFGGLFLIQKPKLFAILKLYMLQMVFSLSFKDRISVKITDIDVTKDLDWDQYIKYKEGSTNTLDLLYKNHISTIGNYQFLNATLCAESDTKELDDGNNWQTFVSVGGPSSLLIIDNKNQDVILELIRNRIIKDSDYISNLNEAQRLEYKINEALVLLGTHLCNIQHSVIPYGGDSKQAILNSNYYSYGNYYDASEKAAVVFDGDTFIQPFEYVAAHKSYNDVHKNSGFSRCMIYSIPVESNINLAYTYGNEFSKNISDFGITNLLINPSNVFGHYIQDKPLYQYNSAYSSNPINKVYTGFVLEDDSNELDNTDYRVYHSDLKANKENIDSWLKFQSANFTDLETKLGPVTELKSFNDQLIFWQQKGFGRLGVNDRSIITDESNLPTILGNGGVLDRYYYIDRSSGMADEEYCDVVTGNAIYWFDDYNQELKSYNGDRAITPMSKQGKVLNIMQEYSDVNVNPSVNYDSRYNEVLFNVFDDKQLVYNELLNTFTSVYTIDYEDAIEFHNKMYLINITNNKAIIGQWNADNEQPTTFGGNILHTKLQYSINKNHLYTKVFDNQLIISSKDISKDLVIDDDYFAQHHVYSWKTELNDSTTDNLRITNREGNYRFAIPRKNNSQYGDRIRGRYLLCTIEDTDPKCNISMSYVITKFRTSWI